MLKVTVKLLTEGKSEVFYDDEPLVVQKLHQDFPESREQVRLDDVIQAINEFGNAEVEAEPYREPARQNMLHENYLTRDEGEDPWVREA